MNAAFATLSSLVFVHYCESVHLFAFLSVIFFQRHLFCVGRHELCVNLNEASPFFFYFGVQIVEEIIDPQSGDLFHFAVAFILRHPLGFHYLPKMCSSSARRGLIMYIFRYSFVYAKIILGENNEMKL